MRAYKIGDSVYYNGHYQIPAIVAKIDQGSQRPYLMMGSHGPHTFPGECRDAKGEVWASADELTPFNCPNCNTIDPMHISNVEDGDDVQCHRCGAIF